MPYTYPTLLNDSHPTAVINISYVFDEKGGNEAGLENAFLKYYNYMGILMFLLNFRQKNQNIFSQGLDKI
jgi:hypothetical protein